MEGARPVTLPAAEPPEPIERTGVLRAVEPGSVLVVELDDGSTLRVRPRGDGQDDDEWPPRLERK